MKDDEDLFKRDDEGLYEEIRSHRKVIEIKSRQAAVNVERQFRYIYVDQPKYMLGQGSFGRVFVCFYEGEERNVKLALKIIKIPEQYEQIKTIQHIVATSRQQIIALIKLRQNPHIIQIQDIVREKNLIYIMLEFCNEKDLCYFFDKLRREKALTSQIQIRYYFHQILDAFKQLNKYNFMHRDMKPSNILVNNGILKVADFGLARQFIDEERDSFEEHVGTMITAAPQIVLHQEYTNKCDIYSLGVILYWMIFNRYPFDKPPTKEDLEKKIVFPKCREFNPSEEMLELLRDMLTYDEGNRIQWVHLLQHELFNAHSFQNYERQERRKYNEQLRLTYGRNVVSELENDDLFLDTAIPPSYYKFIRQIDGQQEFNRFLLEERNSFNENSSLYAHKMIKDEYRNQDIRIKFYRMLILELESFDTANIKIKHILIRDLLIFGIQKYMIYRITKIKDQLLLRIPPTIFSTKYLKEVEEEPLHKDFINWMIQKVRGAEFLIGSKFSVEELQKKCEKYEIKNDLSPLFEEIHERNEYMFLVYLDQCVIQFIYVLKPQIQRRRKGKDNSFYKALVLCVHHLMMFSMQNQIFPSSYHPDFPYCFFIEMEQYKTDRKFRTVDTKVCELLSRFQ